MMKGWLGMQNSNLQKMKINIGPQHPSTHGVLRLCLELEGEFIRNCEPVIGYLHRGLEKMAESRTYLQYLPLVDRIDYLSGFFTSYAYVNGVEHLANIEVTERVKYIRILTMELNRLASHLLWLGTFLLDLGATSPMFYTFRDREIILSLFEELTGQRMMYNYYTFGGVRHDVTDEWLEKVTEFLLTMPKKIRDYEYIITNNPIFVGRSKGVGKLNKSKAIKFAITGPNLRASGVDVDLRYSDENYKYLEFATVLGTDGDVYERYLTRIEEMRVCLRVINLAARWLKTSGGDVVSKINPTVLKVPEGEYLSNVEAPRGITSCFIKSDGSGKPYRVKWRTGSFYAVQLLPELLKDTQYADLMAIFGSLDVILPEVDR